MTDKIIRFLTNSLKLDNIEDFDLDFEMVGRDRFDKDQINMVIIKTLLLLFPFNVRCLN